MSAIRSRRRPWASGPYEPELMSNPERRERFQVPILALVRWNVPAARLVGALIVAANLSCGSASGPDASVAQPPDASVGQPVEAPAPEQVPLYEFDGLCVLNATLDAGQPVVGTTVGRIWIEQNNPSCVEPGSDAVRWTDGFRPITSDGDWILVRYRADFLPSSDAGFDVFEGESKVETTIEGRRTAGGGEGRASYFDVSVVDHYIFSDIELTSTGTLNCFPAPHDPSSPWLPCEATLGERFP